MNLFIFNTIKHVDYFIFLDIGFVPLVLDCFDKIYDKIKDKKTIFGIAQKSNKLKRETK